MGFSISTAVCFNVCWMRGWISIEISVGTKSLGMIALILALPASAISEPFLFADTEEIKTCSLPSHFQAGGLEKRHKQDTAIIFFCLLPQELVPWEIFVAKVILKEQNWCTICHNITAAHRNIYYSHNNSSELIVILWLFTVRAVSCQLSHRKFIIELQMAII